MINHKLRQENLKLYIITAPNGTERIWRRSALIYHCRSAYGITFADFKHRFKGLYNGYKLRQISKSELHSLTSPTLQNDKIQSVHPSQPSNVQQEPLEA